MSRAAAATIGRSAPERTATGRPLVAGDPHRVLEMPNMYAQMHVACDEFDVIGLTVPGVPGFPHFGHNDRVAWCVTHAFVDIHDLYVERFSDDGGSCLFKDQWEPVRRRREEIVVKGEAPVVVDVAETRHGPVIVGDPSRGWGLALRSMQFTELDRSFDALLPMMRAQNVEALYEATREWGLIDHNLVAGDVEGNIGYRVRAKVPRRPRSNGWLPVPGWNGEHEWDGVIDWSRMPAAINPPGGAIVTANNRVAENGEDYLCTDAMPPHRARRVWRRLEALTAATVEDMAAIHRDVETTPGLEMRERLRGAAQPANPEAAALRRLILAWDGLMTARLTGRDRLQGGAARPDQAGGRAKRPRRRGAESVLRGVSPGLVPENQLWWTVPGLLRNDDRSLLGGATWDELLHEALVEAAASPLEEWGVAHLPRLDASALRVLPRAGRGARPRLCARRRRQRHGVRDGMRGEHRRARGLRLAVALRLRRRRVGKLSLDRVPRRLGRTRQSLAHEPERGLGGRRIGSDALRLGEDRAGAASRQRLFFRGADVYASEPEKAPAKGGD